MRDWKLSCQRNSRPRMCHIQMSLLHVETHSEIYIKFHINKLRFELSWSKNGRLFPFNRSSVFNLRKPNEIVLGCHHFSSYLNILLTDRTWLTKTFGSPTQDTTVRVLESAEFAALTLVWSESTVWTCAVSASERRPRTLVSTSTVKTHVIANIVIGISTFVV